MQGLVNTGLGVEAEAGVDLSRDLAGDDVEDLLAELDQETVQGIVDLAVNVLAGTVLLGVVNSNVNQLGVLGLLGSDEDQAGVGGGIFWEGERRWLAGWLVG